MKSRKNGLNSTKITCIYWISLILMQQYEEYVKFTSKSIDAVHMGHMLKLPLIGCNCSVVRIFISFCYALAYKIPINIRTID